MMSPCIRNGACLAARVWSQLPSGEGGQQVLDCDVCPSLGFSFLDSFLPT